MLYYRDGALLAVDAVNTPGDYMAVRKALTQGATISAEAAADSSRRPARADRPAGRRRLGGEQLVDVDRPGQNPLGERKLHELFEHRAVGLDAVGEWIGAGGLQHPGIHPVRIAGHGAVAQLGDISRLASVNASNTADANVRIPLQHLVFDDDQVVDRIERRAAAAP